MYEYTKFCSRKGLNRIGFLFTNELAGNEFYVSEDKKNAINTCDCCIIRYISGEVLSKY